MGREFYAAFLERSDAEKREYLEQLAMWLASFLHAVPAGYRNDVLRRARALAASGDRPYTTPFVAIPPGADMETAAALVSGIGAQIEALLQATPDMTVDQVIAMANSIATGVPVSGDPISTPQLPSAAAVLLESAVRRGKPEMKDPEVVEALIAINDAYDCCRHALPLGGGFWDSIKTWWAGNFGSDEEKAEYQKSKQVQAQTKREAAESLAREKAITKLVQAGYSQDEAANMVDSSEASPVVAVAPESETAGVNYNSLEDAVAAAHDNMKDVAARLQQEKQTAKNAAMQLARLKWAQAALEAPEDVAALMADAKPDWSSTGGALQSAVDLLAAAKQSENIPVLKVFTRILSGLKQRNSGAASWLETMLSGDASRFFSRLDTPADHSAAAGLAEFLKMRARLEDPFEDVPEDVRREVIEL